MQSRTRADKDDLRRDFPKTAPEFEARWGGKPACNHCSSTRVWAERDGTLFECADCGHQTSLTSGTALQGTRKPLRAWFRAVFEIRARRNGISAKDPQRIIGFGSYETACGGLGQLPISFEQAVPDQADGLPTPITATRSPPW